MNDSKLDHDWGFCRFLSDAQQAEAAIEVGRLEHGGPDGGPWAPLCGFLLGMVGRAAAAHREGLTTVWLRNDWGVWHPEAKPWDLDLSQTWTKVRSPAPKKEPT